MSDNKNVNNKEKGFVVGGYTFKTKQEAQEAKDEMNAIKYLSGKTDSKDPKQVYGQVVVLLVVLQQVIMLVR